MATFVFVHGFWVTHSSWDRVIPPIQQAGHNATAITLPGTGSLDDDRAGIGLADHVRAITDVIDATPEPVVLVGSSFAGRLVQIVSGERADRISLAVYVDAFPQTIPDTASDEPAGPDIPFTWDELTTDELRDLDPELREEIEAAAVPFPAGVVRDGWQLREDFREVPALVIVSGFDEAQLDEWRRDFPTAVAVLDEHPDLMIAWLPTGHWPHLTRPDAFTQILLDAL